MQDRWQTNLTYHQVKSSPHFFFIKNSPASLNSISSTTLPHSPSFAHKPSTYFNINSSSGHNKMSNNQGLRTVSFSQFSEMVEISSDDAQSKAYSAAEMGHFKQDCVRDVRSMLQLLASTRSESMTEDIVSGCVGIELYLNMDLMMLALEKKRAHARAVIEGQHVFGEKELANTSTRGSHWARERAANVAASSHIASS